MAGVFSQKCARAVAGHFYSKRQRGGVVQSKIVPAAMNAAASCRRGPCE